MAFQSFQDKVLQISFFTMACEALLGLVSLLYSVLITLVFPSLFAMLPLLLLLFFINLFIYFWLCWVFVAACGLSLVVASGGYSSLWCAGFSLWWLHLLQSMGSRCMGFSSCGRRAQYLWLAGFRAQAQQLWCMGLVALWHVGSSQTRAETCVLFTGRQILSPVPPEKSPCFLYFGPLNIPFP